MYTADYKMNSAIRYTPFDGNMVTANILPQK